MRVLTSEQVDIQSPQEPQHAVAAHSGADGAANDADDREDDKGNAHQPRQGDDDDDEQDSDLSDDDSEEDEEEEARLAPLARIRQKLRDKQEQWMEARRHPILEWKEEERWRRENAAFLAAEEEEKRRIEVLAADKAATQECKLRRRAQTRLTAQKAREAREALLRYDQLITKQETRTALVTAFAREDFTKATKLQTEQERTRREKQVQYEEIRVLAANEHDLQQREAVAADVQQSISLADEMGRRLGILPAIHTPLSAAVTEQDETSSILILRVNPTQQLATASPSKTDTATNPRESPLPTASSASGPSSKRLFFTVNLKRFKHIEEIRGEQIGDKGGVELARSLLTGACPRVKRLSLGWNRVKYSAIKALSDSFIRGSCGQLHTLDLRYNSIDGQGIVTLLTALDQGGLPELVDLVLQGNLLGDDGAKALAHAMLRGTLKALRTLDVRQNRIRNTGVLAIWNAFTSECFHRLCPKLQRLDMRRNDAQGALTRSFCPCPPYLEF